MSKISVAIKKYLSEFIKAEAKAAKAFFSKSLILIALTFAAVALLNPLLEKLKKAIQDKINESNSSGSTQTDGQNGLDNNNTLDTTLSDNQNERNIKVKNKNKNNKISASDKALSTIPNTSNITDDDILTYVKNNKDLQGILNCVSNDMNNTATGNIKSACDDPNYYKNKSEQLAAKLSTKGSTSNGDNGNTSNEANNSDGNDYINVAIETSDFDEDTDNLNKNLIVANNPGNNQNNANTAISGSSSSASPSSSSGSGNNVFNDLSNFLNKIEGLLPYLFLFAFIILKVKDLLTKSEHPSPYRGHYLQRLIRFFGAMLKAEINAVKAEAKNVKKQTASIKPQIKSMLSSIKIVDAIILAVLAATLIYINNRKKHQSDSLKDLEETSKTLTCKEQNLQPFDVSSNVTKINSARFRTNNVTPPNSYLPNVYTNYDSSLNDVPNDQIAIDTNVNFNNGKINTKLTNTNVSKLANCNIDTTAEPYVPHEPFESKLKTVDDCKKYQTNPGPDSIANFEDNISLEDTEIKLDTNPEKNAEYKEKKDIQEGKTLELSTKAIFENISSDIFKIQVKKDQLVTTQTILGTLGANRVYSSVNGIVSNVEAQRVFVDNISDPRTDPLNDLIKKLQGLYKELNNTKLFIKDVFIDSQLPIMLNSTTDVSMYSNVTDKFNEIVKDQQTIKETYEKNVQSITGADNVKEKSENDKLDNLKDDCDNEEKTYFNSLKTLAARGINEASVTYPLISEFVLIDYYFSLYQETLSFYDQNEIVVPYRDKLNSILVERFFIDKWDTSILCDKVNDICNKLSAGTYLTVAPNYYVEMLNTYNTNFNINDVSVYLSSLVSTDSSTYSQSDIQKMHEKAMYVFNFSVSIKNKINLNYATTLTDKSVLLSESSYINTYFNTLWKRYEEIPNEINETLKKISDIGAFPPTYTLVNINNEQYRYYALGNKPGCPVPPEINDDYTSGNSTYGYGDIEYWRKYCNIATLTSVTNPISGWSTGIPPPIGPILLPVIYIPLKVFQQKWGVIVFGITICGMWIYPFVLIVNFSMLFNVPFIDPVAIIRESINVLKYEITETIKMFKQITLKGYIRSIKNNIDNKTNEIKRLKDRQKKHKENKPKKDKTKKLWKVIYAANLTSWEADRISMTEQMVELKTDKFTLEIKYAIFKDAYDDKPVKDNPDPKVKTTQKTKKSNDALFAKLKMLSDSIENFLVALPNAATPVSANFLFTLKNPMPLIKISDELSDNINHGDLDKITSSFKLTSNDFMKPNFKSIDWKKYKGALQLAMFVLIKKDAFPKYQNLKITNIHWLFFLYNDFTPTGAKTFGFPGFMPLPM
jgi:hypothetical protein